MLKTLKANLREEEYPFFSDSELEKILVQCGFDTDAASYRALIIKAENDSMHLPDVDLESSRRYWLSLAALYRKNRTGFIKRGGDI